MTTPAISAAKPGPARDPLRHRAHAAAWIERNPHKRAAHNLLRNAIRKGLLERRPCHCGKPGQAHHPDYGRPLDVRWLCPKHHKAAHRTVANAGAS